MSFAKSLFVVLSLVIAQAASASVVKCTYEGEVPGFGKGEYHEISLKLDSKGTIVQWSEDTWAKVNANSIFSAFGESIENYGFEWDKSFVARNGFSILELGTTADSFTVGANAKTGKGFYQYKDIGSGAGNLKLVLECSKVN